MAWACCKTFRTRARLPASVASAIKTTSQKRFAPAPSFLTRKLSGVAVAEHKPVELSVRHTPNDVITHAVAAERVPLVAQIVSK